MALSTHFNKLTMLKKIFDMKKYIIGLLAVLILFSACRKRVDPVDTFNVSVEYRAGGKNLTGDITANPKDSIYLDFTITSPTDMSYVEIQRNGTRLDTFRLNADKRSFTLRKGYMLDSSAGDYRYRVLARDKRAVFMGDGGKEFTVTVKPDFDFWSYRILAVPDTAAKTNKTYYSTKDGKTYSYSEGAAVSGSIDFGYYYDVSGTNKHSFYALSAPQTQLSFYDISSWTKNATLLKKMPSSVNFVTNLRSSGAINTLIAGNMTSGTSTKVTGLTTSGGNNVVGFKTVTGKYGAILVRFTNQDSPAKETVIEVDVKVQK
jgi:hypothetical protein